MRKNRTPIVQPDAHQALLEFYEREIARESHHFCQYYGKVSVWSAIDFLEIDHQQVTILFRHAPQEPIGFIEGLAGKIHLSSQLMVPAARNLVMDMRRPSPVRIHLVRARFDRSEGVSALRVGFNHAPPLKIWIHGGRGRVVFMVVTAMGIGLPYIHQCALNRVPILVENLSRHANDLPLGAFGVALDQG